jgi:hypothetical protein
MFKPYIVDKPDGGMEVWQLPIPLGSSYEYVNGVTYYRDKTKCDAAPNAAQAKQQQFQQKYGR